LQFCFEEHGGDSGGGTGQPVYGGKEYVLYPQVFELVHDARPLRQTL
jgi:hypothetical protein